MDVAPPQARGWTLAMDRANVRNIGSPAGAGMDPPCC